jgi:hypothetical protein
MRTPSTVFVILSLLAQAYAGTIDNSDVESDVDVSLIPSFFAGGSPVLEPPRAEAEAARALARLRGATAC